MTKKYRLLKEFPDMNIGSTFIWGSGCLSIGNKVRLFLTYTDIDWLIDNGWIEEVVEKKTLEDKISEYLMKECTHKEKDLVEIAKAHFLEIAPDNNYLKTRGSFNYERGIEDYKQAIKDAE